jgi:hypothetical protein
MLKSTENKGFQLTFENGLTISVQFGAQNYCKNRKLGGIYGTELNQQTTQCENAEIMIWDREDNDFIFERDIYLGWLSSNEVAIWITQVANAKNLSDISKLK